MAKTACASASDGSISSPARTPSLMNCAASEGGILFSVARMKKHQPSSQCGNANAGSRAMASRRHSRALAADSGIHLCR